MNDDLPVVPSVDVSRARRTLRRRIERSDRLRLHKGTVTAIDWATLTLTATVRGQPHDGLKFLTPYVPVVDDEIYVQRTVDGDRVVLGSVTTTSSGAWTDWVPTVVQNGVRGINIKTARVKRLDPVTITGHMQVSITNAGAAGSLITSSLPDFPAGNTGLDLVIGSFILFRTTGTRWAGSATWASSLGAVAFIVPNTINALGVDPGFALANGDLLSFSFLLETDGA